MGGGGGTWGSEQRMFHPWQYKHNTVCDLKRLGWEGHGSLLSIVWTVHNLLEEAARELPVQCLRAVTGQARSAGLCPGLLEAAIALSWISGSACQRRKGVREMLVTYNKAQWENWPNALGLSHTRLCPLRRQAHPPTQPVTNQNETWDLCLIHIPQVQPFHRPSLHYSPPWGIRPLAFPVYRSSPPPWDLDSAILVWFLSLIRINDKTVLMLI